MAFTYNPTPQQRPMNAYEQAEQYRTAQQPQQQQPRINPMQAFRAYDRLSGLLSSGSATTAANPALLSVGSGAAGLGGSGLIGSAGGATSAAATQGAGYGLGGSLVGGTGTVGGSTFAGSAGAAGSGAAAGGAASGAAAGGGAAGTAASSGPWGWLAAAILLNETNQVAAGNRSEGSKYWTDLATGNKIVERDADTIGEWIDPGNDLGLKGDYQVAGDITSGDFSNAFKGLEDTFGVKTIKKLF